MSLRQIAKQNNISHSTLSRVLKGNYKGNTEKILAKIIGNIDGVIIPAEKYLEILRMLELARFPQKFQSAHRTAAWLWDSVNKALVELEKKEVTDGTKRS